MGNKAISLHPVDDSFCGGARLTRAPQADSRARARDERGGEATERIGWGGCGGTWYPAVAASSRPHAHSHTRSESVGEGVVHCYRAIVKSWWSVKQRSKFGEPVQVHLGTLVSDCL